MLSAWIHEKQLYKVTTNTIHIKKRDCQYESVKRTKARWHDLKPVLTVKASYQKNGTSLERPKRKHFNTLENYRKGNCSHHKAKSVNANYIKKKIHKINRWISILIFFSIIYMLVQILSLNEVPKINEIVMQKKHIRIGRTPISNSVCNKNSKEEIQGQLLKKIHAKQLSLFRWN